MSGDHGDVPKGPEILPDTWEYQFVARVVEAVENRTGVPTRWSGRLFEEPDKFYAATARDDGDMTVNIAKTLDPVRLAYTTDGPLTADQADAARVGAYILIHEAKHFANQVGDQTVPGATRLPSASELAMEEAFADTWTYRNDVVVLEDLGLREVAPEVLAADSIQVYDGYNAGNDRMLQGLAKITGLEPDQVRAEIEHTERTQRFNKIGDLLIDHRLDGLVPDAHRGQIQDKLTGGLKMKLADLRFDELSGLFTKEERAAIGVETAEDAIGRVEQAVTEVENHYRGWQEQNGTSAEPPRMKMSMGDVIRLRQEKAHRESAVPAASAAAVPDPEVAQLRKFLDVPGSRQSAGLSAAKQTGVPDNVRKLHDRPGRGPAVE